MKFKAVQKNTRQTPRKIRLVANQVKKLSLEEALKQLAVIRRKSTLVLLKTIKQAMANAKNNHGIAPTELEIDEITVTEGPRYRRFRAVSRGRAHGVIKRNSHVTVVLKQKDVTKEETKKEKETKPAKAEKVTKTEKKVEKKAAATTTKKAAAKKTTKKSTSSKKSK